MSKLNVYHHELRHNEYAEFFIKYEVDAVIAEKDKEIAELKDKLQNVSELLKETREWLIESQKLHKRCADGAIKKIRHHKYKRCLAMSNWCMSEYIHSKCLDFACTEQWYWRRWHIRWRKLADKFKEAK